MSVDTEKQALALAIRTESAHLQDAMSELRLAARDEVLRVREKFDVLAHVKANVAAHPGKWMLGAFALGLVVALNSGRRT